MDSSCSFHALIFLLIIGRLSCTDSPKHRLQPFFQGSCGPVDACDQGCIPDGRGYYCSCEPGFRLEPNGYACAAVPADTLLEVNVEFDNGDEDANTKPGVPYRTVEYSNNAAAKKKNIVHDRMQGDQPMNSDENVSKVRQKRKGLQTVQCEHLVCNNDGTCVIDEVTKQQRCQCKLGYTGKYCEEKLDVRYPLLSGFGYVAFPPLQHASSKCDINIRFRPDVHRGANGLLLYTGDVSGYYPDFFSIALKDGYPEFRFDCGSGEATITSSTKAKLGEWNTLIASRVGNKGWISLNNGPTNRAEAEGLFTHVTLREELFLGGHKNLTLAATNAGVETGFYGCVEELIVNGYKYDSRWGPFVGDALHGVDVAECSSGVCKGMLCYHGGTCAPKSPDKHICLCALGFSGPNCETTTVTKLPLFNGYSYLEHEGLKYTSQSHTELEVIFKPTAANGVIIYNGHTVDRRGDFMGVAMKDGHLEFRFDLGTGPAIIRSKQPLELNKWYVAHLKRTGSYGEMRINNGGKVTGLSQGPYRQLTLKLNMYIGGHRNYDEVSHHLGMEKSFEGCIQKVVLNSQTLDLVGKAIGGMNIGRCDHPCADAICQNGGVCRPIRDTYTCDCPLFYANTDCEDNIRDSLTVPRFSGHSYMVYTGNDIMRRIMGDKIDVYIKFRATEADGLIFWASQQIMTSSSDFVALSLVGGRIRFQFNLGSGETTLQYNISRLDDGEWHEIRAQRYDKLALLEVNGKNVIEANAPGSDTSLTTESALYIGGLENIEHRTLKKFRTGLHGCISKLKLATDYDVKLIKEASKGQNIDKCFLYNRS
ncbi:pikachurin-like isoform X2 [Tubulanus polymorphus]|uniref:pikachurin-like isoform X2 n=1 Tax=Tubulanus polymorphus TaxID=672921 RepID=UPI003DA5DD5A